MNRGGYIRVYFTPLLLPPFHLETFFLRRRGRQKSSEEESSGHALMNIRAVESARTMEYYDRAEWRRAKYIRIRGRLWLRKRQRYLSVRMQRAAFRHGLIYLSWLARFLTRAPSCIQGGAVKNHYLNTVETYNIRGSRAYITRGKYIIQT